MLYVHCRRHAEIADIRQRHLDVVLLTALHRCGRFQDHSETIVLYVVGITAIGLLRLRATEQSPYDPSIVDVILRVLEPVRIHIETTTERIQCITVIRVVRHHTAVHRIHSNRCSGSWNKRQIDRIVVERAADARPAEEEAERVIVLQTGPTLVFL